MGILVRLGIVIALSVTCATVFASIVVQYSFSDLCEHADGIVHARVVEQQSEWRDGRIVTEVTLEVLQSLKGEHTTGERVVILSEGGVVGDLATRVHGAPVFFDGEEVVVFLEENDVVGLPLVAGMNQGKFSVTVDIDSGGRVVSGSTEGLFLVEPELLEDVTPPSETEPPELELGPLPRDAMRVPLDSFLGDIRSAVEAQP